MAWENLDSDVPPFFRQGLSAFSRLLVYLALGLLCMVADARWGATDALRAGLQTMLYPAEWLVSQPGKAYEVIQSYGQSIQETQSGIAKQKEKSQTPITANMAPRELQLENDRLRELLELKKRPQYNGQVAQILRESGDLYSHKITLDKGLQQGVQESSPVVDAAGVIGQVTRVYPFSSEVTLSVDKSFVIPVMNSRTGVRGVVYGNPYATDGTNMELRYMIGSNDVEVGDLLTTNGIDGIYPPGLPVAKVVKIDRRATSSFSKIYLTSLGTPERGLQVMVLPPQSK